MTTLAVRVTGMHCASCTMLIDEAVEDLPGVLASRTDLRSEQTLVQLDGTGAGPVEVVAAIVAEGYGAQVV